jgi:hypothetical protein
LLLERAAGLGETALVLECAVPLMARMQPLA